MSITEKDIRDLRKTPCPPCVKVGLNGEKIRRMSWIRYLIDDGSNLLRSVDRYWADQWAEENLSPADYVDLLDLFPKRSATFSVLVGPGVKPALRALAKEGDTTVSALADRLLGEWVERMEPENWWRVRREDSWSLMAVQSDEGVPVSVPHINVAYRPPKRWEQIRWETTPLVVEACRRINTVHTFTAGDVLDYLASEWCRHIGRPVDRGIELGTLRLV